MYLCSCKDLTEEDVQEIARALAGAGSPTIESLLAVLDLDEASLCGLCLQAPEQFIDLALAEWAKIGVRLADRDEFP